METRGAARMIIRSPNRRHAVILREEGNTFEFHFLSSSISPLTICIFAQPEPFLFYHLIDNKRISQTYIMYFEPKYRGKFARQHQTLRLMQ